MSIATAKITCENSDRVITIIATEKNGEIKVKLAFDPPLGKDEKEATPEESAQSFIFNSFLLGMKFKKEVIDKTAEFEALDKGDDS